MLNTGATPDQINGIIRTFLFFSFLSPNVSTPPLPPPLGLYELRRYGLYESPSDLPSTAWWLARRGIGGVQSEAWAWARVARADELTQAGFDESQIDRKPLKKLM